MNTSTIFIAVFLAAFLIGCNNELNLMDSYDNSSIQQSSMTDNDNMQLLWKHDELCVRISNEFSVQNKVIYNNPPLMYPADYLITFDSYTDANKRTNGFIPIAQVNKDAETVFEGTECPEANPQGICHREIKLVNVRFSDLTFYIELMRSDNPPMNNNEVQCTLRLSDIKVYLLE